MSLSTAELVELWSARDRTRALVPADHTAIASSAATRALVIDLVASHAHRDLLHAFAVLGHLLAKDGASPTLLASTIGNLVAVLQHVGADARAIPADDPSFTSARAALAEGYTAARLDAVRAEAARRWEPPACVVPINAESVAIVGGYPDDDGTALAEWAGRVANAAARGGARRAYVTGGPAAVAALEDALGVAGVSITHSKDEPPPKRAWFARKK